METNLYYDEFVLMKDDPKTIKLNEEIQAELTKIVRFLRPFVEDDLYDFHELKNFCVNRAMLISTRIKQLVFKIYHENPVVILTWKKMPSATSYTIDVPVYVNIKLIKYTDNLAGTVTLSFRKQG